MQISKILLRALLAAAIMSSLSSCSLIGPALRLPGSIINAAGNAVPL